MAFTPLFYGLAIHTVNDRVWALIPLPLVPIVSDSFANKNKGKKMYIHVDGCTTEYR